VRARPFSLASGAAVALAACAAPRAATTASVELALAADEAPADGQVAFPSPTYESVVRFDLPPGKHKLLRARVQVASAGTLRVSVYGATPLEGPADPIYEVVRVVEPADVSDGRDGRWVIEDLGQLAAQEGIVFLGVRKEAGQPTLWSTGLDSGRAFMRNLDPQQVMGLAPVRRTPRARIDVTP